MCGCANICLQRIFTSLFYRSSTRPTTQYRVLANTFRHGNETIVCWLHWHTKHAHPALIQSHSRRSVSEKIISVSRKCAITTYVSSSSWHERQRRKIRKAKWLIHTWWMSARDKTSTNTFNSPPSFDWINSWTHYLCGWPLLWWSVNDGTASVIFLF